MKKLIVLFMTLVSSVSFAKTYGEAGCGLGSVIHGKEGNQILAATTNGTSATNIFGISSGTSNCVDHGRVAKNKEIPLYIEANQITLTRQAARGEGEVLTTLAQMMQCEPSAFGQALQKEHSAVFMKDTNPESILRNIQMVTAQSGACGA